MKESCPEKRCPVDGRHVHHRWQPWTPELELIATMALILLLFLGGVGIGYLLHSRAVGKAYQTATSERDHWRTAYETLHQDVADVVKHFDDTDHTLLENDRRILAELKEMKEKKR